MARESFLSEAFILAVAGLISRVLGAIYRVPLTRLIGQEGLGLYQLAYPIYVTILQVSTSGINIAISKLVAERVALKNIRGARRVFETALIMLAVIGAAGALLLFLAAGPISANLHRDSRSYFAIIALAPAIFFVALMATFRGFFQGFSRFTPTALSQVTEQLMRVFTALTLGYLLLPRGVEYAAAGASFGASAGAFLGLSLMVLLFFRGGRKLLRQPGAEYGTERRRYLAKRILALSIPISLAAIVLPLMTFIDSVVVPLRLSALGLTAERVTALYGQLTGMAMPVINMPTVVTFAFGLSLVPAVSTAFAYRDLAKVRQEAAQGARMTVLLTMPAVAGLFVLATPIMKLLYDVPEAGRVLAAVAPGLLFLALQQTTSGVLQGLGRTDLPVRHLMVGALTKTAVTCVLTAMPRFGITGAAIGSVTGFLVAASLNIASVVALVGFDFRLGEMVLKPAVAITGMGISVRGFYFLTVDRLGNDLATLAAIGVGVLAYLALMLVIRGFKRRDFEIVPRFGDRLADRLQRIGLIG
ncbi:MAG: putative polysaccharide biosynthesis protein [Chloroflexota bacterium]